MNDCGINVLGYINMQSERPISNAMIWKVCKIQFDNLHHLNAINIWQKQSYNISFLEIVAVCCISISVPFVAVFTKVYDRIIIITNRNKILDNLVSPSMTRLQEPLHCRPQFVLLSNKYNINNCTSLTISSTDINTCQDCWC